MADQGDATPDWRPDRSRPAMPAAVVTSRLAVGSSATLSAGRAISARAMATRWHWPTDS